MELSVYEQFAQLEEGHFERASHNNHRCVQAPAGQHEWYSLRQIVTDDAAASNVVAIYDDKAAGCFVIG